MLCNFVFAISLYLSLIPRKKSVTCGIGNLHAFECNLDVISRGNDEVIPQGEAECNLATSECNYIQNCTKKHVITY